MKYHLTFLLFFSSGLVFSQNKSSNNQVKYDSVIQENFFLFILDSTNSIQSPKKFKLDDNDCYLQINGNYAVISYRLRGKNEFASGPIYQTGKMVLNDSITYKTISFKGDNQFDFSNQGKRFYFAFREKDSDEKTEVIICSNTFTPTRFFKSHKANEIEKINLINRSKSQNSSNGF